MDQSIVHGCVPLTMNDGSLSRTHVIQKIRRDKTI